jgi:NIPSNAP protein
MIREYSMLRRKFLAMAASSAVVTEAKALVIRGSQGDEKRREFYELRRYRLQSGPHVNLAHDYLRDALVPALNRLGIKPVGVFNLTIGPEAPSVYVLMPCSSLETLIAAGSALDRDAAYLKAADAFLNAPAKDPAYARVGSSLLQAFEGTKLAAPAAETRPRMFELRTYESPSDQDHKRKVEEFKSGEMDSFRRAGFWGVFFAASLIGPRLPNLTYMLGFNDLADRDKKWDAFRADPGWTKLNALPRFTFEAIVSNTTNTILTATPYSQI